MEKKKTLIIFGVSSFVGSNLAQSLKDKYRVIGTYFENRVSIKGMLTVPCDVLNRDAVQMVLYTFKPDVAIYCVGLSSLEDCQGREKYADALNTMGVFNVSQFSERYKAKFIYISSAYIFSGEKPLYFENDTPDPNTIFGRTKASAEFYVQKSCLDYILLRCCNFYGRSINARQFTWFENVEQGLFKNKSLRIDDHIRFGFLDVQYLGLIIHLCLERDITNKLLHISSKDVMTYYEFVKLYANIFKLNNDLIQKGKWEFPLERAISTEIDLDDGLSFRLEVQNIEAYLDAELPTVEDSLVGTFDRLGGKLIKSSSKKQTTGIEFI
ncbi:MAG: sugar nucleotide-binding protein [Bacteriovoracaceae bacterium]|jgi:dTDP-4-dehydrorhamnose reductase|nr:sugar nucleotide-binding protein [Bacteriovoracaceae bacterium]